MKEIIEGKFDGRKGQGRNRIGILGDLKEGEMYIDTKRRADDRVVGEFQGPAVWQNTRL